MNNQENFSRPMSEVLSEMAVGDRKEFPIEKLGSVRAACSTYSLQLGRKFKAIVDKDARRLDVVRML